MTPPCECSRWRPDYTPLPTPGGRHVSIIARLIDHRADTSPTDENGETPLHLAAHVGHLKVVRLLIERHVDIEAASAEGYTPLHMAAEGGHSDVIRALCDEGHASVQATTVRGTTPLHWAAFHGHARTFMLLLARGASLHAQDSEGETPLTLVEGRGDSAMLAQLHEWVTREKRRRAAAELNHGDQQRGDQQRGYHPPHGDEV